jgi:hypothetical protein
MIYMADAFKPLDTDAITALLSQPANEGYPPHPQEGPVRFVDKEMRCLVSGYKDNEGNWIKTKGKCNSSTYVKVEGIPTCMIHAVHKLNEMIVEREASG